LDILTPEPFEKVCIQVNRILNPAYSSDANCCRPSTWRAAEYLVAVWLLQFAMDLTGLLTLLLRVPAPRTLAVVPVH